MKPLRLVTFIGIMQACVLEKAKDVELAASLSTDEVSAGDEVKLSWSSNNAKSCSLQRGTTFENIALTGEMTVKPSADETFIVRCDGHKPVESALNIKVYPLSEARIEATTAQILLGETTEIAWECRNAENVSISANGEPFGELKLSGASLYSPSADSPIADAPETDVEFSLVCANKLGRESKAMTKVKVISVKDIKPSFQSLTALDSAIEISQLKTDCGEGCRYAAFEPESFERDEKGAYIASPAYRQTIENRLNARGAKVALLTSKTVSFDFSKTFGYGHRQALDDAAQKTRCEQSFPYGEKDAVFASEPEFFDRIESNTERLAAETVGGKVVYDIEVSTKAIAGVLKAGTEANLSYKLGHLKAESEADYTDFDRVRGSYRMQKDGTLIRSEVAAPRSFSEAVDDDGSFEEVTLRTVFPAGYPVPPAANGYTYDPNHSTCKTSVPQIENKRVFNSNAEYCGPGSPFKWELECEPGSGKRPPAMPYTYIYYTPGQPFSAYVQPVVSQRVKTETGIVQCKSYFPQLAETYKLGDNWTAQTDMQFFVTGPSRFERTSENDWRFPEIEPGRNFCVDRWKGLPWNDYLASLSRACTSTELYNQAVKAKASQDADNAFAAACGNNQTCIDSLGAMVILSQKFSPQALSEIIERESVAMQKAKAENRSYFITEEKLAPAFIADARTKLALIESGLDTVQSIHTSNNSNWISANKIVSKSESVPGFDSYQESKNSIPAYKRQLDRVNALTDIDLRVISCGYESKGRFRKYEQPKITGDVTLEFDKQNTVKTAVKTDTKLPK